MHYDTSIIEILKSYSFNEGAPATEEEIDALKQAFKIDLPADFESLLRYSNGDSIYGFKTPFIVYTATSILTLYREFDYYLDVPEFMIWGGDGGGILFAYDRRDPSLPVCVFYQDDSGYDKILYKTDSITSMVKDIVNGKKLNDSDPSA